jgi:hypothetical protein
LAAEITLVAVSRNAIVMRWTGFALIEGRTPAAH